MKYRSGLSHAAIAVLLLLVTGCTPARANPQINLQSEVQKVVVEEDVVQVDDGADISAEEEPPSSQVRPLENGKSLLESRCAQCHIAQSLEEMRKLRSEWEVIFSQMEALGIKLSDDERAALLDYLAVYDE